MADEALGDLAEAASLGLSRGDALLTRGERAVAARIAALDGDGGRLYARIVARKPDVFAEDGLIEAYGDVGPAIAELERLGLVDRLVSWDQRAAASPNDALRDACRSLDLPTTGVREVLLARLRGRAGWCGRAWVRVRHRGLVQRLWRFALLTRWDASKGALLERLGVMRWPAYTITAHQGLWFSSRETLLWWERTAPDALDLAGALDALGRAEPLVRGLDLRHDLRDRALELAQAAERRGDAGAAIDAYDRLASLGALGPDGEVRRALAREAAGDVRSAIVGLEGALRTTAGADRIPIQRTLRRLSRRLGRGIPPDPPMRSPVRRKLHFDPAATDVRPRYRVRDRSLPVEQAAIARLGEHGRRAVHAEGSLWTTLFALLFAEAYFLPIPGALPVPRLSGPLDVGTPRFAAARSAAVAEILAAVEAGEGPDRVAAADARWRGTALAGASWWLSADDLRSVAAGMAPSALAAVLRRFCAEGWPASRGLPDLAVFGGPEVALARSFPSRLPACLVLAECKGPTDSVRDAQAYWHHVLAEAGVRVELWEISASGGGAG